MVIVFPGLFVIRASHARFSVIRRHSCQAAEACDYSKMRWRGRSPRYPCSNRLYKLTNVNRECLREEMLAVLLKDSDGKRNVPQT
jgi:hypothetical protein